MMVKLIKSPFVVAIGRGKSDFKPSKVTLFGKKNLKSLLAKSHHYIADFEK